MSNSRIFISSTSADLAGARMHVVKALQEHNFEVVLPETISAAPAPLDQLLTQSIRECDGFLLIAPSSYGPNVPGTDVSAEELGLREAQRANIPHIVFIQTKAEKNWNVRDDHRAERFFSYLAHSQHSRFGSEEELVEGAVAVLLRSVSSDVLDADFYKFAYRANSLVIEDFHIGGERYCSRLIFEKRFVHDEYHITTRLGALSVEKRIIPKWSYVDHQGPHVSFDRLAHLLKDRFPEKHVKYNIDPAPHGQWPLWNIARHIQCGARLLIIHDPSTSVQEHGDVKHDDLGLGDGIRAAEHEFGISLERYPFLRRAALLVMPYEDAWIDGWRIVRRAVGDEGLRINIRRERFLPADQVFRLKCQTFSKEGALFFTKEETLHKETGDTFTFYPTAEKTGEIWRVEAKLFSSEKCIDEVSGYPLRQINVSMHIQESDVKK